MVGQQVDAMANPEQLAQLRVGVENWNNWARSNSEAGIDLSDADMSGADLRRGYFFRANFRGANLEGANFRGADLNDANLTKANLRKATFDAARLRGAGLSLTRMDGASFVEADLTLADLVKSNLSRSSLIMANCSQTDFSAANLVGAVLLGTNLRRADLSHSRLTAATVGDVVFGDNDLSTVEGLESIHHSYPSTLGIDTIYRSKGNIPEKFLQGCGVPHDLIIFMRSLTANPMEFYSCFISYSSKDAAFVTELHTKLQAQNVRCWKDSEEIKIGDKVQEVIDSAIRLHDKLLLVLSEHSINSSWVEWEVKKAFKKEQEQGSTVLFPVRLDDAVMETPYQWAAEIRKRHIGDFRKWKDHDSFQKSLDRLLRDLKSQDSKPK